MRENLTVGFIGLGLIGGSIAKAIRRTHPAYQIIAYDIDRESLTTALSDGTLNGANDSIDISFSKCNIIFLCAPVGINIDNLNKLKRIIQKDCIITDVGSVKTSIHEAVIHQQLEDYFIGGHPMTGSELIGYANTNSYIFENAYYIITPSAKTKSWQIELLSHLVESFGALPIILDYQKHDFITEAISHLPHIVAYSLVNLIKASDDDDELMKMLAAGGFKDISRIASASPALWQHVCIENKNNIHMILQTYLDSLNQIDKAILAGDEHFLLQNFIGAKQYRDNIPAAKAKGYIQPLYEIHVDIIDESGAIATLSTILASNGISIKNIGIVHNREFQEGALRIEFEEADATKNAAILLRKFHYTVHERT